MSHHTVVRIYDLVYHERTTSQRTPRPELSQFVITESAKPCFTNRPCENPTRRSKMPTYGKEQRLID